MPLKLGFFFLSLALLGLTGCVTTPGDSLDEASVYRAQDQVFRPMAN